MRIGTRLLLIVGLLAGSLLAPRPANAQQAGPVYVVQPGDTLWGIALAFGLDAATLASANGMATGDSLAVGRELLLPGFEGISGVLERRSIGFGETLRSLALRHGVLPATLTRLNRLVNAERMYIGQEVIFPVGEGDGLLIPQGAAAWVRSGETEIELSMRTGHSAWALRTINGRSRLWSVPGETLVVPNAGRPTTDLPAELASLELEPAPLRQGWAAEVTGVVTGDGQLEGALGPWRLNFEPAGEGGWVALQGIHALAEPGMVDLTLRLSGTADGVTFAAAQPVYLASGDYGFDPILNVPDETIDPAVTSPENERVAGVVSLVTPERLWQGAFVFPAPYTESFPSRFGSRRNYNGTGYNYYHSGLDFYGGTGTEITAPARGRVVLAEALTVRGKTIILDHGWGVFTAYFHQSEILVATGDVVEAGQTIGLVGATGRVTGAHLHWEVWVGGVPVDPQRWVERAYP